ncbi:unnamed protein product [Acanthoscelides obtectus]|uniref:Myb/SANT-like DNA-binding domain-containing protein n=1 Tax=Acanthoscelides obtectus TaxID=200917 RepID=A0A9P0JP42_ACAOB|nr:unnamed protein product [Acanthoscelides obtectus]CAK1671233.1 hypothetical protein AOBTE_LOCUS28169 [Acanthoscelides obtectus]
MSASACIPCSTLPPAFPHPLEEDEAISGPAPSGVEKADEEDKFLWPTQMVFLLLSKFEEHRSQLDAGEKTHKSLWLQIAEDIKKLTGSTLSHSQLQSKLNGLKNRYKIILARKGRSGSGTNRWPYLERMEELFGRCAARAHYQKNEENRCRCPRKIKITERERCRHCRN